MALRKRVELDSGVDVDYWRIVAVNANLVRGTARVELLAWRNAAARNAGRQPIHDTHRVVELPADAGSDIRVSALYAALAAERRVKEPARVVRDPATGATTTIPEVVEIGFFYGAEDI